MLIGPVGALALGALALGGIAACSTGQRQAVDVVIDRSARAAGIDVQLLVTGLERPLGIVDTGLSEGWLLIVTQEGRLLAWRPGGQPAVFLDISDQVSCCDERGLLGLALHPRFADNGRLFVYYTDTDGDSRVAEFRRIAGGAMRADPAHRRQLLRVKQPTRIHNGGQLQFGPDGYLYIALGDGGHFADRGFGDEGRAGNDPSGRDPEGHAQDMASLLGKLLRIDVDSAEPYAIPADNPFADEPGARGEIWALGLRNPWRFSFDRLTGDLFVADVGRDGPEEINRQPAGRGGLNYGWPMQEGSRCDEPSGCDPDLAAPVVEYGHDQGCAVIGGYSYRGRILPAIAGHYLFADFCSGQIFAAERDQSDRWRHQVLMRTRLNLSAFGEDRDGELLLVDLAGAVYRLGSGAQSSSGTKRRAAPLLQ